MKPGSKFFSIAWFFISLGAAFLLTHRFESKSYVTQLSSTGAPRCEGFFNKRFAPDKRNFSPTGLQRFFSRSGRIMVYDWYQTQWNAPVMVFIHGLGDNLYSLQKLAEKARADGFSVLRIDLHGHGETLNEYLLAHDGKLPAEFNYRDNIDDLKELILHLGGTNISLVGHSYGGGIALKLAEEMEADKLKGIGPGVHSVHAMAPYVQRIEKYLFDFLNTPRLLLAASEKSLGKNGFSEVYARSIFGPLARFMYNVTKSIRFANEVTKNILNSDSIQDQFMDPVVEKQLSKAYHEYFLAMTKKSESELTPEESKLLDLKVRAAILVTKGIRDLDYLNPSRSIGALPEITHIIGGDEDPLVVPPQLQDLIFRFDSLNIIYSFTRMKGRNSHHFFPQAMADDVYESIIDVITLPR